MSYTPLSRRCPNLRPSYDETAAAGALNNLACYPETLHDIADAGAIPGALRLIRDALAVRGSGRRASDSAASAGGTASSSGHEGGLDSMLQAAGLLRNLVSDPDQEDLIEVVADALSVPVLLPLLEQPSDHPLSTQVCMSTLVERCHSFQICASGRCSLDEPREAYLEFLICPET
eukprot:scaffold351885_cov40-Prasinocladus_malaysianus.AAC.3